MADESPVQVLCEEMTCSVCLDYFKDPVMIDCGHIFCQSCITECCGKSGTEASCPQCRETVHLKNFRPNRQLASLVEAAKKFSLHRIKGAEASGHVCERHQEPLKLFCQDDEALICVVCDKSKEHREHKVIPKEEAFEECKGKVQTYLEFLKKKREAILSFQQSEEIECQTLLERTEAERQKIMAGFKQRHQFLEEQESRLLAELKGLEDQIKDKRNAHICKLCEEYSSVDLLIKEMEEKQKQPASEFLQDIGNILQRFRISSSNDSSSKKPTCRRGNRRNKQKFVNPVAFPLELKQQIEKFSESTSFLDTMMKEFKDTVLTGPQAKKANDDGVCAIPTLVLSKDCPNSSQSFGFSCWSYIMGVERISSGNCSWVMNIKDEKFWVAGVALEYCRRRNVSSLSPQEGICVLGKSTDNQWYAFISSGSQEILCPWSTKCMRAQYIGCINTGTICVSLNYEQGSVTFSNSSNNSIIYTFHSVSFSGQPVSSWVLVGK